MYIRSHDDALLSLADILELPERRDQIIQITVQIMLCLEVGARIFMADCQALLIEGGLETLRARRKEAVEAALDLPVAVEDPEDDRLFEEVASALDALRFSSVVRQIFPELRSDRWQIARAILLYEAGIREQISVAVRSRGEPLAVQGAYDAVNGMIQALRPSWSDRLGTLRTACLEALKTAAALDPDRLHEEAELLFELFATSDERAPRLLAAIDQGGADAVEQIEKLREMAEAARALRPEPPPPSPGDVRDVA